jgi:hypothetical protein
MELPHAQPLDVLAAEEIGSLLATLEAVDGALADGRVENKRGQVRHLLDVKARLSRQLREWLKPGHHVEGLRAPFDRAEHGQRASDAMEASFGGLLSR